MRLSHSIRSLANALTAIAEAHDELEGKDREIEKLRKSIKVQDDLIEKLNRDITHYQTTYVPRSQLEGRV